jgi:chromosome segregation ATPase
MVDPAQMAEALKEERKEEEAKVAAQQEAK